MTVLPSVTGVKVRSRWNFEAGQAVKQGYEGSLEMVKVSPGAQWAWLMLDSMSRVKARFFCAVKGSSTKI